MVKFYPKILITARAFLLCLVLTHSNVEFEFSEFTEIFFWNTQKRNHEHVFERIFMWKRIHLIFLLLRVIDMAAVQFNPISIWNNARRHRRGRLNVVFIEYLQFSKSHSPAVNSRLNRTHSKSSSIACSYVISIPYPHTREQTFQWDMEAYKV